VSAGTLQLGSGGASGSLAGAISVASGATLALNRTGSATFANLISGAGGLTNVAGTNTLSAANTYSGNTQVSAGTLKLGASGSIANSSSINVASGAVFDVSATSFTLGSTQTLTGAGSITGPLTLGNGAHLAPGTSGVGTLTFNSGLTFNTGSVLDFQLGSSSDLISITSGTLAGTSGTGGITLNLFNSGGFTANTYNLINFNGATASGFETTDFSLGSQIGGYTYAFQINSNVLQLVATATAVPEPATTAALFGLGATALVIWRRRRSV
jgi:fibronectin-binding autotransporter adhesin